MAIPQNSCGFNPHSFNSFSTHSSWNALDFQKFPSERTRRTKHISLKDLFSDNPPPSHARKETRQLSASSPQKGFDSDFLSSRRGENIPNNVHFPKVVHQTPKNDFDYVLSLSSISSSISDLSIEKRSNTTPTNWRKNRRKQEIARTLFSPAFSSFLKAKEKENKTIFEKDSESSASESDEESSNESDESGSETDKENPAEKNICLLRLLTEKELRELDLSEWNVNLDLLVNKNPAETTPKQLPTSNHSSLLLQKDKKPQLTLEFLDGPLNKNELIKDKLTVASLPSSVLPSCSPFPFLSSADLTPKKLEKEKKEFSEDWPKSKILALAHLLRNEKAQLEKVENLLGFKKWLRKCCCVNESEQPKLRCHGAPVSKEKECQCSTLTHRFSFLLLCFSASSVLCAGFDSSSEKEKYCCVESYSLDLDKPPKCFVETLKCPKITKFYIEMEQGQEGENIKNRKKLIFNPHVLIYNFIDVLQRLAHLEKKKKTSQVPKVSDFLAIWNVAQISIGTSSVFLMLLALHFLVAYNHKVSYSLWKNLSLRQTEESFEIPSLLFGVLSL